MLSHLQQRKLTRYFNVLDQGAKGYIVEEDIYTVSLNMTEKKGITEGSEEWSYLRENIDLIWNYAREFGVTGDPDKVYLIDWLAKQNVILSDKNLTESYLGKIMNDVFELFCDDDKKMFMSNYQEMITSFGLDDGISKWAFQKMDVEEKGFFSHAEYKQLVMDFHFSTDRHTPGNYFFGPF